MLMSLATLRSVLLWSTVINYGFLIFWCLLMVAPHGWMHRLWGRRFRLSEEHFDAIQFSGIVLYKLLIVVFNLVPYIALRLAE